MSIPQEPKNTSSSVKRRADAGLHKQHQQPVDVFVVLNGMLKSRWLSALAGIVDSLTAPHVYSHLARQVKTTTMLQVEFLTLSGAPTPGLARGEDRTFCTQWESLHLHQLPIPACTFLLVFWSILNFLTTVLSSVLLVVGFFKDVVSASLYLLSCVCWWVCSLNHIHASNLTTTTKRINSGVKPPV